MVGEIWVVRVLDLTYIVVFFLGCRYHLESNISESEIIQLYLGRFPVGEMWHVYTSIDRQAIN